MRILTPILVQYCNKCGEKLKVKKKSGKKETYWLWYCPNKRFWNKHTKFKADAGDGSE